MTVLERALARLRGEYAEAGQLSLYEVEDELRHLFTALGPEKSAKDV
jgi:hypothetical protein